MQDNMGQIWQALIENLTREKIIRAKDNNDGNISIVVESAEQKKRIGNFLPNLTKKNFDETRAYRLTSAHSSLDNKPENKSQSQTIPPEIPNVETAREFFSHMFDQRVFATLDLNLIFASVNNWEPDNIARFEDNKLFSIAFDAKFVYQMWYNVLQNIYKAFNEVTQEDAQAALEGKKPLTYKELDLVGSIKTFLQECIFLYKFTDPKTDVQRVRLVMDFARLIQFLYPPVIQQVQVEQEHVLIFNKAHFMAYIRQVSGGNLLEIFETDEADSLSLRPILLSNTPSLPPPVKIKILADCSGSMESFIKILKQNIRKIRDKLAEKFPEATFEVIIFNNAITRRFTYTMINAPSLVRDLEGVKATGDTALHHSIQIVLQEIFVAEQVEPSNTIFIVFTDGEETVLEKTKIPAMQDAIQQQLSSFERNGCRRPQVVEFGMGIQFKESESARNTLEKLAEKTDGKLYLIEKMQEMLDELFSQKNLQKMQTVRQILELLIQHDQGKWQYQIPLEASGEPQMPEIIIPVPKNQEVKITIAGNEFSMTADPAKLHESAIDDLSSGKGKEKIPDLVDDEEIKAKQPEPVLIEALRPEKEKEKIPDRDDKEPKEKEVDEEEHESVTLRLNVDIKHEELELGRRLGAGGFGEVFQATYQGQDVAVKCLLNPTYTGGALDELKQEAGIMNKLRSDFVVQIIGVCIESPHFCIVMEYLPQGNLYNLLHSKEDLSWEQRCVYAQDIANGLRYLHKQGILHRDLKSFNVLLTKDKHAKLCDFGLALARTETMATLAVETRQQLGTPYWMAPETLSVKAKYSKKSDVYGMGIVFFEIAAREIPYAGTDPMIVLNEVQKGVRPDVPNETPRKFANIMTWCWEQKPTRRPQAKDVVEKLEKCKTQLGNK
jgi:tRNA A-37 threonylcarbamoyl transferase component Bud32